MENKITALSDDELMEVTGGLVQLLNNSACSKYSKEKCHNHGDCKCGWNTNSNSCMGSCM